MQLIVSRRNKTVQYFLSLRERKNRKKHGSCLVEGVRFVTEAIVSGSKVEAIALMAGSSSQGIEALRALIPPETQCFEVPPGLFKQLAETDSPQGILAAVKLPERSFSALYTKGFRGLVLDCVQDPGNVGTMIRSAHAMGFHAVLATKGTVDVFNGKTLRSTMGSVFHIPVVDNLDEETVFSFVNEYQLGLIAAGATNGRPCDKMDLSGEFLLVIGNEGNGISSGMEHIASAAVCIPMPGGAESLNAAVAASVLMYESNRQRSKASSSADASEPCAVF